MSEQQSPAAAHVAPIEAHGGVPDEPVELIEPEEMDEELTSPVVEELGGEPPFPPPELATVGPASPQAAKSKSERVQEASAYRMPVLGT